MMKNTDPDTQNVSFFPDPAESDEDGCLGYTPDLDPVMLADAYRNGIFPWPTDDRTILWFSPPERGVLFPGELHLPERFRRMLKKLPFHVTVDEDFSGVIRACAEVPRPDQAGTWITPKMIRAYKEFHAQGFAHSFEVRTCDGKLAGGLYGVSIGKIFCGESMFHCVSESSKFALLTACRTLQACGVELIDTQMVTPVTGAFGARTIPREEYLKRLRALRGGPLSADILRKHLFIPAEREKR